MNVVKMKLSALKRPERNVRMHTEKQLKEFERSVTMFGQIRPIVVDDDLTILAGNGLYETLLRMGREEADVLKMSDLTENQKKKLMLADNRIYGLGIDDNSTLDAFLAELQNDLDIPGYDEEILQSMMAEASEVTDQIKEYGILDPVEVQEINAAKERKAQMIESNPYEKADLMSAQPEPVSQPEPEEPEGQFVICPKCGEKIWL